MEELDALSRSFKTILVRRSDGQTLSCLVRHSLVLSDTLLSCQALLSDTVIKHDWSAEIFTNVQHTLTWHMFIHILYIYYIIIIYITYHTCSLIIAAYCCDVQWLNPLTISVQCTNSTSAAAHAEPTRRVSSSPISSPRSSQSSLVELGNHGKAKLGNTMKYQSEIHLLHLLYSFVLFALLSRHPFRDTVAMCVFTSVASV